MYIHVQQGPTRSRHDNLDNSRSEHEARILRKGCLRVFQYKEAHHGLRRHRLGHRCLGRRLWWRRRCLDWISERTVLSSHTTPKRPTHPKPPPSVVRLAVPLAVPLVPPSVVPLVPWIRRGTWTCQQIKGVEVREATRRVGWVSSQILGSPSHSWQAVVRKILQNRGVRTRNETTCRLQASRTPRTSRHRLRVEGLGFGV